MNRTSIEWVKKPNGTQGYTWNPITGCLNNDNGLCKDGGFPCYAYKLANTRLKQRYLVNSNWCHWNPPENGYYDPFYPRFWEERLEISHHFRFHRFKERQRYRDRGIFVCDMGELFGDWIPLEWQEQVFQQIKDCPNDRFYLLTKQPQNLIKFSPFPENCWVGVTATNAKMLREGLMYLEEIQAKVKFVSLEPLLSRIYDFLYFLNALPDFLSVIDWLIIGACTGSLEDIKKVNYVHKDTNGLMPMPYGNKWTLQPRIEWVQEIVEAANKAGIPVFLKDNLRPLLSQEYGQYPPHWAFSQGELRQEMPMDLV